MKNIKKHVLNSRRNSEWYCQNNKEKREEGEKKMRRYSYVRGRKPPLSEEDIENKRKHNLEKLHPMAAALLAREMTKNKSNEWLTKSADTVLNNSHLLTDKWIRSINKWSLSQISVLSLDDPEYEEKKRYSFKNFIVSKVIEPKADQAWPSYACILKSESGWKHYVKSNKFSAAKEGDLISLSATAMKSAEGITFFSRPSSIVIQSSK